MLNYLPTRPLTLFPSLLHLFSSFVYSPPLLFLFFSSPLSNPSPPLSIPLISFFYSLLLLYLIPSSLFLFSSPYLSILLIFSFYPLPLLYLFPSSLLSIPPPRPIPIPHLSIPPPPLSIPILPSFHPSPFRVFSPHSPHVANYAVTK